MDMAKVYLHIEMYSFSSGTSTLIHDEPYYDGMDIEDFLFTYFEGLPWEVESSEDYGTIGDIVWTAPSTDSDVSFLASLQNL